MARERRFPAFIPRELLQVSANPWMRCLVGLLIFILALAGRFLLLPVTAGLGFLTFYPAIAFAALVAGTQAALVVVLLGGFAGYYVFTEPVWAFKLSYVATISLAVYALAGTMLCLIARRKWDSEEKRSLLSAIVDSSEEAIASKSLDGIITTWNAGAERLFGYAAAEVIGKPITILFPPDRLNEEVGILTSIARGEKVARYETIRICKDGSPVDVSVTMSPIRDPQGSIMGTSKPSGQDVHGPRSPQFPYAQSRLAEA